MLVKLRFRKSLFFGVSLVLLFAFGCQQDDFPDYIVAENISGYKITRLNYVDLQQMEGVREKLDEFLLNKTNITSRGFPKIRGFEVDTVNVLMAEMENFRSFNFQIIEEQRSTHRNLVLNREEDESYTAYVVEYDLSEPEKEILKTGGGININGKASLVLKETTNGKITAVPEFVDETDPYHLSILVNDEPVAFGKRRCGCPLDDEGGGSSSSNPMLITVINFQGITLDYNNFYGGGPFNPVDLGVVLPGGGGGGGSGNPKGVIVTPVVAIDPIAELNKITEQNALGTNGLRNKIDEFVGELHILIESGVEFSFNTYTGMYSQYPALNNVYNGVSFSPVSQNNPLIRIHKHHNELHPIFSFEDIFGMAEFFYQKKQVDSNNANNITSVMVSKTGLHAFRVKNPQKAEDYYDYLMSNNRIGAKNHRNKYKEGIIEHSTNICIAIGGCTYTQFENYLFDNFLDFFKWADTGFDYYFAPHPANPNDNYIWTKQN